jgi:hypothetical protein
MDDIFAEPLQAATLPSPTRKTALEVKKEAENPI